MKGILLISLAFVCALASCSNNAEEYKAEAERICSCMTNAEVDAEDASSASLNVGFCMLDAKVDLKAAEMKAEIKKQCPEFVGSYASFVRELK